MTEATCSLLGWDPNLEAHPSSVGELNANCSAKIMSVDSEPYKEVPVGERGEIWVQGPKYVWFLFPLLTRIEEVRKKHRCFFRMHAYH